MRRRAFAFGVMPLAGCAGVWRREAPEANARPVVTVPGVVREELSNGGVLLRAAGVGTAATVEIGLSLAVGAEADPPGRAGLTALALAAVVDRGLRDELGELGAAPRVGWNGDGGTVVCAVAAEDGERLLKLVAERVREGEMDEAAFAGVVARALGEAIEEREDLRRVASRALDGAVFPAGHPYVHRGVVTPGLLRDVERLELRRHMQRVLVPGNLAWVLSGAGEGMRAVVEAAWRGWAPGGNVGTSGAALEVVGRGPIVLVDRPGADQAVIAVGRVGPSPGDPAEVYAVRAARMLRSAVHERLRGDRGLAYYVDAGLDDGRRIGRMRLMTQVDAGAVGEALKVVLWALEHVREIVVAQRWMDDQDVYDGLEQVYMRDVAAGFVSAVARRHRLGLPLVDAPVRSKPARTLERVVDELMRPAAWQIVCVGDSRRVLAQLERFGAVAVGDPRA